MGKPHFHPHSASANLEPIFGVLGGVGVSIMANHDGIARVLVTAIDGEKVSASLLSSDQARLLIIQLEYAANCADDGNGVVLRQSKNQELLLPELPTELR
jgi:hypothetical protein